MPVFSAWTSQQICLKVWFVQHSEKYKKNKQLHFRLSDFWNKVLWTDELFGLNAQCHVWQKANTAFQEKYFIPAVKYDIGAVMVWFCSHRISQSLSWPWTPLYPEYSRGKYEAICVTAKTWSELDHVIQWSTAHQQIYFRIAEK